MTWTVRIEAGASADLTVVATNPSQGDAIVWKTHQRYADGATVDWVGARGSGEPAPVTTLVTVASQP